MRTIIFNADTSNATTPSAADLALLPLKQPNKDFYRFEVGLDIKKVFTSLFEPNTTQRLALKEAVLEREKPEFVLSEGLVK